MCCYFMIGNMNSRIKLFYAADIIYKAENCCVSIDCGPGQSLFHLFTYLGQKY